MSEQQQDKGKGAFRKAWDAQKKQAKKHNTKPSSKTKLHPRNPHNGPYNLDELVKSVPELEEYITLNVKGEKTVKFAEPQAVLLLNKGLLLTYYDLEFWEIPENSAENPKFAQFLGIS